MLGDLGSIFGDLGAMLGDLGVSRKRPEAKAQKRRKRLEGGTPKFAEGPRETLIFDQKNGNSHFQIREPKVCTRP